ncbi:TonB-dependent receptor [Sphingobium sp. CR2-8]|uniref:TonB-dependent receptor n=1 Tax=Sphingobium sp. CR2-8 TaxID=1306534 RepID=UPI002DBFFFB2|nr:TonB-dependent receptor [Sphingobium sp. CR2-8]MEC3909797.1 TonB-dependent receptor [Sphingobium sp. CR2-8]
MGRSIRTCFLLSGTALAVLVPLQASAQASSDQNAASATAPGDNGAQSDIVVTGERIGAGQSRAAAVLTAADIAERPLGADITQSLVKVPGVQISTGDARGGSFSFELYLRGLNKEQVGLTIDGIPTGDARFNGGSPPQRFIDSSNIGKISVSQSAGDIGAPSRFALGGFIDFGTDDPATRPSAAFEAGYGSYDFYRQYFRVDSGEIWRGLTAYGSFSHQQNDVWAGRNSRSSYRDHAEAKIVQTFDNGSFIKARVSYNDQRDNDFNIITRNEFLANPRSDRATDALTGIPSVDVDYGGALGGTREDLLAYVNARLQLGDHVQININPYYQTLRGESNRQQDRSRQLAGADPYAVTGYNANGGAIRPTLTTTPASVRNVVGGPEDLRITPRDRDRYGVTGEVRFDNLIPNNMIRFGGWYEGSSSTEERRFYRLTNPISGLAYNRDVINYVEYSRSADIDVMMLYAQDQFAIIPDLLRLDAGVTWMKVRYEARSPLEYSAAVKFSQASSVNPKIGLSLKPARHVELFGGYAKNFAGIPEDAFLGSTAVIAPADLSPIQTENFDLGARYTAGNFAFSVQGFHVHLKNNIGIVPRDPNNSDVDEIVRGNVATRAANIQGVTTKGIEVTGLADFGVINVYAAYSYQDAKHDDPAIGSADRRNLASVAVIGGARVRDIPMHSAFGQIGVKPFEGATLNLTGRYVGSRVGGHIVAPTTFAEIGVEKLPSYKLIGLNANYRVPPFGPFGELLFQFNVDNLFDEKYIGAVSSSTASQPEFGYSAANPTNRTLDRYFIGAPRTYTLSMRAKF